MSVSGMRIIVTGATGFIGRRVTKLLLEHGHEVTCLLRSATSCPRGATSLAVDLSRPEELHDLPPSNAIVHLAQSPRYREFPDSAADVFAVNTASTARLLNLAARNSTEAFVLASSGNVYSGADAPWTEDAILNPGGFYGASKAAAEMLLPPYRSYFRACALRLFTPYGPGQDNRLIPTLIARIRAGRPVSLDGGAGGLRLSVTYVDDVAATFVAAAEQAWEGTYNVASPTPTCIAEIAGAIGSRVGVAPVFERTGKPEAPPLTGDVSRLSGVHDVTRFIPLEAGIARTLAGEKLG
jgi:nucleoside-diphosphate-sugar epimerase